MRGAKLTIPQEFGSYVMENVLFKISFPAEFHAQTAVECALKLHDEVKDRANVLCPDVSAGMTEEAYDLMSRKVLDNIKKMLSEN